nr:hypothetical protein [uncultured Dyadobacter sp.]
MKTSEDKFNEALGDVLKRKFDDYEEQPNPNAYARIRARVKPSRGWKYRWLTGSLALITFSGLMLNWYQGESNLPKTASNHIKSQVTSPGSRVPETVTAKDAGHGETRAGAVEHAAVTQHRKTITHIDPSSPVTNKNVTVSEKRAAEQPAADRITGPAGNVGRATVNHNRADGTEGYDRSADPLQNILDYTQATSELPLTVPADADSVEHTSNLTELEGMPLTAASIPLHLRGVVAPAYKPAKAIMTNPARVAWLFNVSALHSYQILTVPSSAAKDFQNFNFPSLFTASSMGYKFSGGVERRGIQVQLHYSNFRQTYSYEIANNNYLVKPDEKGEYQTVRQGDKMQEDRTFSMLGLGVAKQLRWGHSPVSRFYANFGLEYSRALNSKQSLGWVSLGLGKQFAISRNTAFSIGPYAEFSPVKVKGFANPFYYQPYRVGISAGLRFVKP